MIKDLDFLSKKIFLIFLTFSIISFLTMDEAQASSESPQPPRIIVPTDIYKRAETPILVFFSVMAYDSNNEEIPVQCDRISGSTFVVGKTTVRCEAIDNYGKIARGSFQVTVGYNIVQIPNWVKEFTGFWVNNEISDSEYFKNLEFLVKNEIIHVPKTNNSKEQIETSFPIWIKTNAEKWVNNELSNDEFSIGISWLIEDGIILL